MPSQIKGLRRKSIKREKVTTESGISVDVQVRASQNIAGSASFTLDDTKVPTGSTGILSDILNWFSNRIKAITGKANWYTAPARTLEQCVDTAGLTTDTIPVATGANTIGSSRIVRNGSGGKVEIPFVSGDDKATLYVGSASSDKSAIVGISLSNPGIQAISDTNSGIYATSSTGYAVEAISTATGIYSRAGSGPAVHGYQESTGYVGKFTRSSSTGAAAAFLIESTNTSDTQPALYVTHVGTAASSGHAIKVLQTGSGKAGEFTLYNSSNSTIALDVYSNGSGICLKAKTEGAGRAGFFEVNRSSATDPAVEIKVTNTSDAGVGLRINGLGTGSMLQVQDNGTNVLEVKDGSKIGFYNVTPVARAAALTGSTGTLANAVTRIGEIETALKNIGIIS